MFTAPERPVQSQGRALAGARRAGEVRGVGWCRPIQEGGHALSKIGSQACKFHFHQLLARPGEFYCGNPTSQQRPPPEQLQKKRT